MEERIQEISRVIRETGFALHRYLKSGHLEKVYENGLVHRLRKVGLKVIPQHPIQVLDEDGTVLGDYFADLFVEDCLIVEIKACESLAPEHIAQLFGYMRASRIRHGILMNFGAGRFQLRKYIMDLPPS